MSRKKRALRSEVLFVLGLGLLCSLILLSTRTGIGSRSEISSATVKAVLQIIAGRAPESDEEAYMVFNRRFQQRSSGGIKIWQNQDLLHQWVFSASGAGMWGQIQIVGVVDLERETMLGMQVVSQNETAGLGSKISDPVFCEQFANLSLLPKVEMVAARYRNNQFDAISGATVSSRALETLINKAISAVRQQVRKKS